MIEEIIKKLDERYPGVADIKENLDNDKYMLFENFVRHFMVEGTRLIYDAQSITTFRELEVQEQISTFVQGLMIAIAGTLKVNISSKYGDMDVMSVVEKFMKLNVEVGVQNCKIIDDTIREQMKRAHQ
jgi:hypothetical protein